MWVANYVDAERAHIEGRMNIRETSAPTLGFLAGDTVVKVLYMSLDMAELRRVAADLAAEGLTDGLDVAYSSNRYLEFNAPGVNKGAGLMELAARLGIARGGPRGRGLRLSCGQQRRRRGGGYRALRARRVGRRRGRGSARRRTVIRWSHEPSTGR